MDESFSILNPLTCGFVKITAYELNTSNLSLEERISKFNELFAECKNFQLKADSHERNFPKIIEKIRSIGKRQKEKKNLILKEFSQQNWRKLSVEEKMNHSMTDCKECQIDKYAVLLDAISINKQARAHSKQKSLLVKDTKLIENKTRELYNAANREFQKSFPGMNFTDGEVRCYYPD